jgi:CRISPR-associated protein Cmr2
VQRFIAEARSTSDVAAASEIYSALAVRIVEVLREDADRELVLPARDPVPPASAPPSGQEGMPNRVVALLPAGTGAAAAARASRAAHQLWQAQVRRILDPAAGEPLPGTPGFPCVQWVCVPPGADGYAAQWDKAHRLLTARRRIRDFPAVPEDDWRQRVLCSLAPRWPAEPKAPRGAPRHEQRTPLSAVGWVKRRWRHVNGPGGFPSTASIASAPYRRAVLRRLADRDVAEAVCVLDDARRAVEGVLGTAGRETPVPGLAPVSPEHGPGAWLARSGGPWVYPERWRPETLLREAGLDPARDGSAMMAQIQQSARDGSQAARRLRGLMEDNLMEDNGRPAVQLAGYLAVVVQDLDSMGLFLGGNARDAAGRKIDITPNEHRRVSRDLLRVARAQRQALESAALLGVPVYAGGDDLLFFSPAAMALDAAVACHGEIPSSLPTASTAVLFFHYHASIQQAMREARELLEEAKRQVPGKHALAVGYLRRSGVSAISIQPWPGQDGESSAGLFALFAREREPRLSPRLAADLERDAGELSRLSSLSQQAREPKAALYRAELARLVRRHAGASGEADRAAVMRVAGALDWLGSHERAPGPGDPAERAGPEAAARVGVFLRQEAR